MATSQSTEPPRVTNRMDAFFPVLLVFALVGASMFVIFGAPHAADSSPPEAEAWRYVFNLGAFILFVCCIIAILPVARQEVNSDSELVCGLVSTAALVPTTIAEVSTVAAYVVPYKSHPALAPVHQLALLIGTVTGLAAWGVWAIYYRRLGTIDRQNTTVYAKLCDQYDELLTAYKVERARSDSSEMPERTVRLEQIEIDLHAIARALQPPPERKSPVSLKWVLSTGYTSLWSRLHAVDEALMALADDDVLFERALGDAQILQQSAIPNAPQLLRILRSALSRLRPHGGCVVDELLTQNEIGSNRLLSIHEAPSPFPISVPAEAEASARVVLRRVRHAIHEFRDATWTQLVRRRNHLLEAVIFTRITSYALVGLAILLGVEREALLAAAVYYFVGALMALFNRLRLADKAEEVEDYGFSSATLVQTTPFSGLAAVGGVLVTSLLIAATNQAHPYGPGKSSTDLGAIFDLQGNQLGLITAAIFGLTPSLLISRLQDVTERHKADLKSTQGS